MLTATAALIGAAVTPVTLIEPFAEKPASALPFGLASSIRFTVYAKPGLLPGARKMRNSTSEMNPNPTKLRPDNRRDRERFCVWNQGERRRSPGFFHILLRHCNNKSACAAAVPTYTLPICRGGYAMGLTRPINALMICAAFAFVGALIVGVVP